MKMKKTQEEISAVLGVTQSTVSKYKNRKLELSYEQGLLLKKGLGWNDDDIQKFLSGK
jgi:transcriptional regulator with XRE-family HTH domain